jgi:hypothetical protein
MSNEIVKTEMDASALEAVLVGGDLSKLTAPQRVQYYKRVCESVGLNPLTKPFEYIQLNGKLTLYAKKDCTDQLRDLKSVSIDDIDLSEVGGDYVVKVKGHDKTGRSDVEIGIVKKTDMQGNSANAQMKAVTKAKRRLTLSLCGLGWLDETEVETIAAAKPVVVNQDTGEIIDGKFSEPAAVTPETPAQSLQGVNVSKPATQPRPTPAPGSDEANARFAAAWNACIKAKLHNAENKAVWSRSPKDDVETVLAKAALMEAALVENSTQGGARGGVSDFGNTGDKGE